jgi:hypothetical protein
VGVAASWALLFSSFFVLEQFDFRQMRGDIALFTRNGPLKLQQPAAFFLENLLHSDIGAIIRTARMQTYGWLIVVLVLHVLGALIYAIAGPAEQPALAPMGTPSPPR